MKKIILLGSSGAGKSTFAKKLSNKINIEVFHLDKLLWKSNWEVTDKNYQIQVQEKIIEKDSWIIDGNYSGTLNMRIDASDTIIFFDINRWICIYHVIKRYFKYKGTTRPDMHKDCPEKLDINFLKFIWHYPKKQKIQVEKKLVSVANSKKIIIFKNKKQVNNFLENL